MRILKSELCEQMSVLSLEKSEIQSDSADIVSTIAIKQIIETLVHWFGSLDPNE